MARYEDYKVFNTDVSAYTMNGQNVWVVNPRVQCYLSEDQLSAIGVDRALVRSVKLAVSEYARIDVNQSTGGVECADLKRVVEFYVKRADVPANSFGFGRDGGVRAVTVTPNDLSAVARLMRINPKTNAHTANVVRCINANMYDEFVNIIERLSTMIDQQQMSSDAKLIVKAARSAAELQHTLGELAQVIVPNN